jgi:SAM-dependent methyltransferase
MLTVEFSQIKIKAGMRVLDAGCGNGRHLRETFRIPGIDVVGIDLNRDDLKNSKETIYPMEDEGSGRWLVAQADVTELPFAEGRFDVVICSEVLEHIEDIRAAIGELVRVLKPGGDLVVTVPRFWPERICWAISQAYHSEPGGHIRIYKKQALMGLLEDAGARCRRIRYRHGLHAPYWWLKCLVGHKNENFHLVRAYRKFLEWDILRHPPLTAWMDRMLNPLIGKSIVFYLRKESR